MIFKWIGVFPIILLSCAINAYMPPAVEIPPVDENQMQSDQRNTNRHVSYSYGTTAYHYSQQQGYASAQLANQNGQNSQTTPSPNQRPECQHPMLRVFFKACHPPGSAPQSPVQCEPIPGQTSFRCLIKQNAWPIARLTPQCAPGTITSNGDCIRLPAGSFSTNGAIIVPVSSDHNRIVQSSSSVYRHCSNGMCQTCIGDQCSTTGIQTPVSVDHRGRSNSSTEVVAFGDAGRDVKQKCAGRVCKTCIDRICYDRSYPLLRVTAGCPPAVCEENCIEFVYWTDQCPICRCRGFASREPCRTQNECPVGSTCRNQVCVYAELARIGFDKVCTFSSQCTSDQMCYNWRCGSKQAQSRHMEDQSCAVDHDCPSGYVCADMTCWEGDANRLRGQACLLNHQCPAGYFCTNNTCTDVYHHGSFDTFSQSSSTIPPTSDRQCHHDRQCYNGETCWENRCVTPDERRRIDDARQRQLVEHQNWRPATVASVPSYVPPTEHTSPEDEYQKRLAEYNRQRIEQERQYAEERRRREEEEQRRHREEEQYRRQQQEIEEQRQRRNEEEENQRRIRENEEIQRRQAIEIENRNRLERERLENQRRLEREREEIEARRRQEEQQRVVEHHPVPTPDIEIGEEPTDREEEDDDAEYERRMQEYNRELRERQRQLQRSDSEEQSVNQNRNQPSTDRPSIEHGEIDESDFYGRTRQRVPVTDEDDDGTTVSSYRIRYHRVRRRQ